MRAQVVFGAVPVPAHLLSMIEFVFVSQASWRMSGTNGLVPLNA